MIKNISRHAIRNKSLVNWVLDVLAYLLASFVSLCALHAHVLTTS